MKTSVIIPAYNEEKNICDTIIALKNTKIVDEIIVVDDGSYDSTYYLSKKLGVKAIKTKHRGKGSALRKGLKYASGDIIVFVDGDIGQSSSLIKLPIQKVIKGECDVAVVKFPPANKKGGIGLVKKLSRFGVKLLCNTDFESVLSGQRVYKRSVLEDIEIPFGFGVEIGMTIDVIKKGYIIKDFQLPMYHRETERTLKGFIHRGRQFFHILSILMLKTILEK